MKLPLVASNDPQIQRLQDELDHARRTIIHLMPEPIPEILDSYTQCSSRHEVYLWESKAADQIIEFAKPLPAQGPYAGNRAYCPLCGGSPESSAYSPEGFALPLGLHRHLTGWGNTRQCDVTLAAFALAREWAREEFREIQRREKAEADARLAGRRATEILYQTGPHREPELFGGQYLWRRPRDPTSLASAEARLQELGFKITLHERIKTYTQEHYGVIVYADPREEGRIQFFVYRFPSPPPARKSTREPHFTPLAQFLLQDAWKRDLQKKYATRLARAVASLEGRRASSTPL